MRRILSLLLLSTAIVASVGCKTCDVCDDCGDGHGYGPGCSGCGTMVKPMAHPTPAGAPTHSTGMAPSQIMVR